MEHTSFGLCLVIQNRFLDVWFSMLVRLITRKSHLSAIAQHIVTETRAMWQFLNCTVTKIAYCFSTTHNLFIALRPINLIWMVEGGSTIQIMFIVLKHYYSIAQVENHCPITFEFLSTRQRERRFLQ